MTTKNKKMKILKNTWAILTVLILISSIGNSQNDTLSFDKMNVAFIGLDNPLTITLPLSENSFDSLKLSCSNGEFKYIDSQINGNNKKYNYIGRFEKPGYYQIVVKNKRNVILTQDIRCKPIPDPIIKLGLKYQSGTISKKLFESQLGIGAVMDNFDFYYIYRIVSYKCSIVENGVVLQEFENNMMKFSDKMLTEFKKLKPDNVVFFENIKVLGQNGELKLMPSAYFRIK